MIRLTAPALMLLAIGAVPAVSAPAGLALSIESGGRDAVIEVQRTPRPRCVERNGKLRCRGSSTPPGVLNPPRDPGPTVLPKARPGSVPDRGYSRNYGGYGSGSATNRGFQSREGLRQEGLRSGFRSNTPRGGGIPARPGFSSGGYRR